MSHGDARPGKRSIVELINITILGSRPGYPSILRGEKIACMPMKNLRQGRGKCLWNWILTAAVMAAGGSGQASANEPVTLQLKWKHAFQFAGYYTAREQGYYREAGLDVTLREASPGLDAIQEVVAGRADYGTSSSSLLLARQAGQPVVALAAIFQHSPYVLIVPDRGYAQSVHDLLGKRIMMEPGAEELLAYLRREGLTERQFTRPEHSFQLQDLIAGKTDAMAAYVTIAPFLLGRASFAYQLYSPRAAGIDFYGDNLFTTEREIRQHPQRALAFREASLKGWRYALEHIDDTIRLIRERYAPQASPEALEFEARHIAPLVQHPLVPLGYMNRERWRHIADAYAELGMLPADFTLDRFLFEDTGWTQGRQWPHAYLAAALASLALISGAALHVYRLHRRLRDSEARFRLVIGNTFDTTWVYDVARDRVSWYAAFESLFGYAAEELGRGVVAWRERIHPDDRRRVMASIRRTLDSAQCRWTCAYRLRRKDGRYTEVEDQCTIVRDAAGRAMQLIGATRDVSDRRRQEAELRHRTHLLEVAQRNAHIGYYEADLRLGRWTSSPVLDGILGIGPRFARTAEAWSSLIHPEDRPRAMAHFRLVVQIGKFLKDQYRIVRPGDGQIRWVDAWGSIEYQDGTPARLIGTIMDITARKTAELELEHHRHNLERLVAERTQALQDSEHAAQCQRQRLADIIWGTHVGTWDWNVVTDEVAFNERWAEILGLTLKELEPLTIRAWTDLVHPDDLDQALAQLKHHFARELEFYECEFRMRHRSGDWVWVLDRGRVVEWREDGKPLRMSGTHLDITRRKESELALQESERRYRELSENLERMVEQRTAQLAAASAAKSQFLAHMSHELRTPLNAILGFAQVLEQDRIPAEQRETVGLIREAGDHLLGIINDVLDLSTIEAGRLRLDRQAFLLPVLVRRVDRLLRHMAETKGLSLQIEGPAAAPPTLLGYPDRLEQVLINLLGNAIKFTEQGQILLTVRYRPRDSASGRLRFEVRDTGIGMKPGVLAKIFQPFSQGDASLTRRFGGTGLGLAISKQLVELMGGKLGARSREGHGSLFWFTVPVDTPPRGAIGHQAASAASPATDPRPPGVDEPRSG